MKYLFYCLFLIQSVYAQQTINLNGGGENSAPNTGLLNRQPVPSIRFKGVLNADKTEVSLGELKGKIVILEFWATWCGPCLPAMKHLDELQKKFPDDIRVIAISDEPEERIQRYIKNVPGISLWFTSDVNHSLQSFFPYQAIPHSVLIDTEGKLVANTIPSEISESVIQKMLKGNTVSLKEKKDAYSGFDFTKDYFPKNPNEDKYIFDLQPPVAGGFPISKRFNATTPPWFGRRFTMMNNSIDLIYRNIYNMSSARVVYDGVSFETDFNFRANAQLFCIDAVVPKGKEADLKPFMQREIEKLDLPYKARLEKRTMECYVITVLKADALEELRVNKSNGSPSAAQGQPNIVRATSFSGNNIPLSDLFTHFETFNILRAPVIDETKISGNFNLKFEFDAENSASFKESLTKLGLKAERQTREVEVLVISKN